jgi:glycerol-3-phosphate O-acyltransferase
MDTILEKEDIKKIPQKPAEPYAQVIERIDEWPIYKLSQDRKKFIAEIDEFTINRLIKEHPKLYDLIAQTIYQERIRITDSPWKVDPPNENQFWGKIRTRLLKTDSEPKTQKTETHRELLTRIVHRYSEEVVGTFNIRTFRFARWFLNKFFNRLLNAAAEKWWRFLGSRFRMHERIHVYGEIDMIRDLIKEGVVVVVPTHFSNLDSILIGYSMDQIMGLPSFSYGAGLNLYNSGPAAFFLNRLGPYRIDRRKRNDIYLETLKAMSNLSMQRGTNSLFFPGGTRARSGMLENKLKMGLLGTAMEAQRALCQKDPEKPKKIFIVPLVLSYHFVLEAPFLIHEHLKIVGKERYIKGKSEGNSLREWFKFIWQFFSRRSDIILSFGKPMDVMGNFVNKEGQSADKHGNVLDIKDYFVTEGVISEDLQREAEYTKLLAEKIVDRYYKENIVLSSHVVAFTAFNMLKQHNENLDLYALLRLSHDDFVFPIEQFKAAITAMQKALFDLEDKGRLKLSEAVRLPVNELVEDGIKNLGIYHVKKPLTFNKKGDVVSDEFYVLYYYHNRLENFGLTKRVRWENFKMETTID